MFFRTLRASKINSGIRRLEMSVVLKSYDQRVSEFDNADQEAEYTVWLRNKVQEAIDSPHPRTAHDEVMRRMQERLLLLKKAA
jgi:hypothetical protein